MRTHVRVSYMMVSSPFTFVVRGLCFLISVTGTIGFRVSKKTLLCRRKYFS